MDAASKNQVNSDSDHRERWAIAALPEDAIRSLEAIADKV